jgi:hypothetical protein
LEVTTRRRAATEPETVIIDIDLEYELRMAAYRELWRQQRAMLDPRRALPDGHQD